MSSLPLPVVELTVMRNCQSYVTSTSRTVRPALAKHIMRALCVVSCPSGGIRYDAVTGTSQQVRAVRVLLARELSFKRQLSYTQRHSSDLRPVGLLRSKTESGMTKA